jgi:hypothetical protein
MAQQAVPIMTSLRPLDPAEVGAVDAALMGQRLLAQTTLRPNAAHIPRQYTTPIAILARRPDPVTA